MSLQQHYGISDEEWTKLRTRFKTLDESALNLRLLNTVFKFDPDRTGEPLNRISLMYFVDHNGDFSAPGKFTEHVAMAMFNSVPPTEKVEIMQYVQHLEEDEDGDQDNDT